MCPFTVRRDTSPSLACLRQCSSQSLSSELSISGKQSPSQSFKVLSGVRAHWFDVAPHPPRVRRAGRHLTGQREDGAGRSSDDRRLKRESYSWQSQGTCARAALRNTPHCTCTSPLCRLFRDSANASVVLLQVRLKQVRGLRMRRARAVRVGEQRSDCSENGTHRVDRRPVVLDEVHAQRAIRVDVRMEHLAAEAHTRRLVRILVPERYPHCVHAALPR
mmetsp:Transcript_14177/g.36715  ORF Transcript_14177/g.36715 Transcript_14177/m.36715 type:complete len:219 (-) Transcript_14177:195-851(-)